MFLIALLGLATWTIASIGAGLLFGRMATLKERIDLAAQRASANEVEPTSPLVLERNRAA